MRKFSKNLVSAMVFGLAVVFFSGVNAQEGGTCCNASSTGCSGKRAITFVANGNQYTIIVDLGSNPLYVCGQNNYDDHCVNGQVHCATLNGLTMVEDEEGEMFQVNFDNFQVLVNGCGTGEGNCD